MREPLGGGHCRVRKVWRWTSWMPRLAQGLWRRTRHHACLPCGLSAGTSRAAEVAPTWRCCAMWSRRCSRPRRHCAKVVLVTGAKFYGIQWGAGSTPCRERPETTAAELLLRPGGLVARSESQRALALGQSDSAFRFRLCSGQSDEPGAGHRALCRGVQGAWHATALSRQCGRHEALHQIADARQIGACSSVGGGCASSRG